MERQVSFSLKGKIALITGGSRGIGKASALEFARMGADVAVVGRNLSDLEKVADEIYGLGRKSLAVAAHVGRLEDIDRLVTKVKEEFGRIDILVNNAGTSPALSPMLEVSERLWDSIMNLNLKGLFFLSQAVAKVMKECGGGNIINVASADAFKPERDIGVYGISKTGVLAVTKIMALEWADYNIRVNAIAPGAVHTRLRGQFAVLPEYGGEMERRTPLKRVAEPEEIVGAMIYLASDASSFTTGATLVVDGGLLLS